MSLRHFSTLRSNNFLGVDWTNEPEKLALGALTSTLHMRVTRDGNLRTMEGLSVGSVTMTGSMFDGVWYRAQDKLIVVTISGVTAYVYEMTRALGSVTEKATYNVTSGLRIAYCEDIFEKVYIQIEGQILKVWDNSTLTSAQADLDDDGSVSDLLFKGISQFDGRLIGFGYGDESGGSTMETRNLGADRPEILRWSDLGDPDTWQPEKWLAIGTRGIPILNAHAVMGRMVVLKPEGVWLVYGDLEQNIPQVEQLQEDSGRAIGATGPHSSTVYDGVLYWMSPRGPMRWAGGPFAEYIGRPTELSMTSQMRAAAALVFPVPVMDAICYLAPDLDITDIKGSPPAIPGNGIARGWLWDVIGQRWLGEFRETLNAGVSLNAFIAPDANGEYQALYGSTLKTFIDTWTDNADEGPQFKTGELVLDEGREVIVKAIYFQSDTWAPVDSHWTVTSAHNGSGTMGGRLYVQSATPTANAAGDAWYDTGNSLSKYWDGTSWKTRYGLPPGTVEVPGNVRCRRMQIGLTAVSQTSSFKQVITEFGIGIRRL